MRQRKRMRKCYRREKTPASPSQTTTMVATPISSSSGSGSRSNSTHRVPFHTTQSTATTHAHCFDKTLHVPKCTPFISMQDDNDSNNDGKNNINIGKAGNAVIPNSTEHTHTHTYMHMHTHVLATNHSPVTIHSFFNLPVLYVLGETGIFAHIHVRVQSFDGFSILFVSLLLLLLAAAVDAIAVCFFVSCCCEYFLFHIDEYNDMYIYKYIHTFAKFMRVSKKCIIYGPHSNFSFHLVPNHSTSIFFPLWRYNEILIAIVFQIKWSSCNENW